MQSLRENAMVLCRNRRKGVSLVIAMCASFLLFSFGFSIVYSASLLLRGSEDEIAQERCRQLAQSFADVLQAELIKEESEFRSFAETVLEEGPSLVRTMAAGDETYGTLTVSIREDEELLPELPSGSFPLSETHAALAAIEEENSFLRRRFTLETRAELEGESYTCRDPYLQTERFQPLFFMEGIPVDWWEGWYLDEEGSIPLEIQDAVIDYSYGPSLGTAFIPAWGEGGGL